MMHDARLDVVSLSADDRGFTVSVKFLEFLVVVAQLQVVGAALVPRDWDTQTSQSLGF